MNLAKLALIFISCWSIAMAKPNIVILATGGTIAGQSDSQIDTTGYKAGVVGVDVLIKAVPEISNIANISVEQVANIDSADMTNEIWLKLANRIDALLSQSNVDGIVITHGTDTMEESAFFLNLVIHSDKPIVITGAMRPASALSADGPKNLYNAVSLAANKDSKNRGVMIVMNDRIQSARFASKTHRINTDSFSSPNAGDMGYIVDGRVFFNYKIDKPHTTTSMFNIRNIKTLPKVDILYSYANDGSSVAAKALFDNGTEGIVVAGSGNGSIHKYQKETLERLISNGLLVVKSSRIDSGITTSDEKDFIASNDLNPRMARILLMLSLTKTKDIGEIQKIFDKY